MTMKAARAARVLRVAFPAAPCEDVSLISAAWSLSHQVVPAGLGLSGIRLPSIERLRYPKIFIEASVPFVIRARLSVLMAGRRACQYLPVSQASPGFRAGTFTA